MNSSGRDRTDADERAVDVSDSASIVTTCLPLIVSRFRFG